MIKRYKNKIERMRDLKIIINALSEFAAAIF